MKIIEHAQLIESQSIEDMQQLAESKKRYGLDIYYSYLAGLYETAYKNLQCSVELRHNSQIKEMKHEKSISY